MNARDDQKARARARILASASRRLRERGIDGTRVADVMADAGLTVGGFYAHFPSKAALVGEALHETLAPRRARVAADGARDWRRRVGGMLDGYLTRAHRDDAATGCPVPAVVGDVARDGTARDALASELDAFARALAGGDPDAQPEAYRAALGALALQAGGLVLARALRGTPLSDAVLDAARALGHAALEAP